MLIEFLRSKIQPWHANKGDKISSTEREFMKKLLGAIAVFLTTASLNCAKVYIKNTASTPIKIKSTTIARNTKKEEKKVLESKQVIEMGQSSWITNTDANKTAHNQFEALQLSFTKDGKEISEALFVPRNKNQVVSFVFDAQGYQRKPFDISKEK